MIADWRSKWYEVTKKQTDEEFFFGFVQVLSPCQLKKISCKLISQYKMGILVMTITISNSNVIRKEIVIDILVKMLMALDLNIMTCTKWQAKFLLSTAWSREWCIWKGKGCSERISGHQVASNKRSWLCTQQWYAKGVYGNSYWFDRWYFSKRTVSGLYDYKHQFQFFSIHWFIILLMYCYIYWNQLHVEYHYPCVVGSDYSNLGQVKFKDPYPWNLAYWD